MKSRWINVLINYYFCLIGTALMPQLDLLLVSSLHSIGISATTTAATRKRWLHRQKYPSSWIVLYGSTTTARIKEEEKEENDGIMAYSKDTIIRQTYTYERIRKAGGKDVINDVYVRNPKLPSYLWFVGKVARCTGTVTLQDAIGKQLNLIQEHAAQLR